MPYGITGLERVKAYYQNGENLVWARRAFCTHFNVPCTRLIPSNHAIKTWVAIFEVSGSTSKKRGGSQKTVRTPENIGRVREAFDRSPRRSAVRHATTLGITPRSVRRILHSDLHYHPYKNQIVQALNTRDYGARVRDHEQFHVPTWGLLASKRKPSWGRYFQNINFQTGIKQNGYSYAFHL